MLAWGFKIKIPDNRFYHILLPTIHGSELPAICFFEITAVICLLWTIIVKFLNILNTKILAVNVLYNLSSVYLLVMAYQKSLSPTIDPNTVAKISLNSVKKWGITHLTSSPQYPRFNGLAEKSVQTIKKLLSKSLKSGSDANLVILQYRNTPIGNEEAPAQLLMGRRLRETLPALETQYLPHTIDPSMVKKNQTERQERQKHYYDRGCRPLRPIHDGDSIHFKQGNVWKPGTVRNKQTAPHSFDIKDEHGHIFRKN